MKLLVFAGSTRIASHNRKLAREVAEMGRTKGAEVTHLELGDYEIPMYNADLEARGTPADVMKLKQLFHEHPAWIICTPEYNASYPALVKNTLDWLSSPVKGDPVWSDDFRFSRGKVVGVLSASPGALGGLRSQSHLVPLLFNLHCWVAPQTYALSRAGDAFDAEGRLKDETAKKTRRRRDRPGSVGRRPLPARLSRYRKRSATRPGAPGVSSMDRRAVSKRRHGGRDDDCFIQRQYPKGHRPVQRRRQRRARLPGVPRARV
jgi:chromate reductase